MHGGASKGGATSSKAPEISEEVGGLLGEAVGLFRRLSVPSVKAMKLTSDGEDGCIREQYAVFGQRFLKKNGSALLK